MTKKTKRTGQSLVQTNITASTKTMLNVGFSQEEAERIRDTRKALPLVEDNKLPCIDARKLWGKLGEPHGRFNDWAEYSIKPLLAETEFSTEISVVKTAARGTPRTDYTLSRDVAAHLAMMTRTPEGRHIRQYFLDMERLAVRLSEYFTVRADALVETDNILTTFTRKRAGDQAKVGTIPKGAVSTVALEREKRVKSLACEIVTGKPPRHWRESLGGGRGVRDALDQRDLRQYQKCYEFLVALLQSGVKSEASLVKTASLVYGGKVDMDKYLIKVAA